MIGEIINREQALAINPSIGTFPADTIGNVLHLVILIQEMCADPDEGHLSKEETTGLYYLCDVIRGALEYEQAAASKGDQVA